MSKRVALYARVSTSQQEQEATIESQIAALEAYAQARGYELLPDAYYLDQAVSGRELDRPGLNRLRNVLPEGQYEIVLCLSADRLSRQYAHQWVLLDEWQRLGVAVEFVNALPGSDGPGGELMRGIQGLFAEYERLQITERLRRGKLYRMQQGELVSPQAAYGYRYLPVSVAGGGCWVVEPAEAAVVGLIYQWYTAEKLTITQIVDQLNRDHTQTPPRGQHWTYSTVQAILTQSAYTGRTYYNRTQTCRADVGRPRQRGRGRRQTPSHPPRTADEWIALAVPPLLPAEIWQRAQEQLALNQHFAPRNNKTHFYLLRSLLVCDCCGRTLVGRIADGQVYYYCPNRGKNRQPGVAPHSRSIAGRLVEPLVWAAVCTLLHNPTLIADAWHTAHDQLTAPDEFDRLSQRQRQLEQQWTRLLDAFQDGLLDKTELAQRKAQLDDQRQQLQQRLDLLTQQQRRQQAKTQMIADFDSFCQHIRATLDAPTPLQQQAVLQLLVDHVVVARDSIVIKHLIPTDDDCRLLPGRRYTRNYADKNIFA